MVFDSSAPDMAGRPPTHAAICSSVDEPVSCAFTVRGAASATSAVPATWPNAPWARAPSSRTRPSDRIARASAAATSRERPPCVMAPRESLDPRTSTVPAIERLLAAFTSDSTVSHSIR
jgi:hypothetical protein